MRRNRDGKYTEGEMTLDPRSTYTTEKAATFLKRLRGTQGNAKLAAASLGLSNSTVQSWIKRFPEFGAEYRRVKQEVKG